MATQNRRVQIEGEKMTAILSFASPRFSECVGGMGMGLRRRASDTPRWRGLVPRSFRVHYHSLDNFETQAISSFHPHICNMPRVLFEGLAQDRNGPHHTCDVSFYPLNKVGPVEDWAHGAPHELTSVPLPPALTRQKWQAIQDGCDLQFVIHGAISYVTYVYTCESCYNPTCGFGAMTLSRMEGIET